MFCQDAKGCVAVSVGTNQILSFSSNDIVRMLSSNVTWSDLLIFSYSQVLRLRDLL